MESRDLPRFTSRTFPVNLADIHNCGDLDLDECSYVSCGHSELTFRLVRKYVAEVMNVERAQSFDVRPKTKQEEIVDPYGGLYYRGRSTLRVGQSREEKLKKTRRVETELRIGLGMHEIEHDGEKLWILMQEIGDYVSSSRGAPMCAKNIVIFVKGRGRREFLQKFIETVLAWGEKKSTDSTIEIYRWSTPQQFWQDVMSKKARPLESVFLPDKIKQTLVRDLDSYLSEQAVLWYRRHGIPYKRMYLFYGTPGAGKTSLIQALAGHFSMNVCFIQPTGPRFTDETLQNAIQTAPQNSIIVIEDIDALFTRQREKEDTQQQLSFSGLLNGLDGITNPDGQIFILTTNHINKLDAALIRSGRVDLRIEFPLASKEQMGAMFRSFYPTIEPFGGCKIYQRESTTEVKGAGGGDDHASESSKIAKKEDNEEGELVEKHATDEEKVQLEKLAARFAQKWLDRFPQGISMATVQQHFIMHMRSTAIECVASVKDSEVWEKSSSGHSEMYM